MKNVSKYFLFCAQIYINIYLNLFYLYFSILSSVTSYANIMGKREVIGLIPCLDIFDLIYRYIHTTLCIFKLSHDICLKMNEPLRGVLRENISSILKISTI